MWRLEPVAKIACFAETGAVFKPLSVFPRTFVTVHLLLKLLFSPKTLRESIFQNLLVLHFFSKSSRKGMGFDFSISVSFSCIFLLLFGLVLCSLFLSLCVMGMEYPVFDIVLTRFHTEQSMCFSLF